MRTGPRPSHSRPSRATSAGSATTTPGRIEVQADPFHRRCPGHAEDQLQHVDAVLAQLQPQTLGEDPGERLDAAVNGVPSRSQVAGQRAEQNNAAPPPGPHRLPVVVHQRQRRRHVEIDDPLELGEIAVQELVAVCIRTRDQDQQAHFEPGRRRCDPSAGGRGAQIGLDGANLAAVPAAAARRSAPIGRMCGRPAPGSDPPRRAAGRIRPRPPPSRPRSAPTARISRYRSPG